MDHTEATRPELDDLRPQVPTLPTRQPAQWRRALRALRELLADPDDTAKAFEVFLALDGDEEEQRFQQLLADPGGARLAAERPSLVEALSDRSILQALPAGSFGRAYLTYLDGNGFEADGLVKLKATMEAYAASIGEPLLALDPTREWFRVRGLLVHDLWHVLTEYGTDDLGEVLLLGFSCAQIGGRANRLLFAGASLRSIAETGVGLTPDIYRAWRRGRRAAWLAALPYEALLAKPLEAVRALAGIEPAATAHPNGIPRGRCRKGSAADLRAGLSTSGGRA
jgi:ubiquinone biosynthesis protein COQ4